MFSCYFVHFPIAVSETMLNLLHSTIQLQKGIPVFLFQKGAGWFRCFTLILSNHANFDRAEPYHRIGAFSMSGWRFTSKLVYKLPVVSFLPMNFDKTIDITCHSCNRLFFPCQFFLSIYSATDSDFISLSIMFIPEWRFNHWKSMNYRS